MKLDKLRDLMKNYGMKPLAEKAGVSRSSLYNLLDGENFQSEMFEKVTKVLNVEFGLLNRTSSYEEVCNHLAYYGAPLVYDKSKPLTMSLEETTKWGLYFSKSDGMLESLLPYFLMMNFKKMNRAKLLSLLDVENQFQLLGYYLDLAIAYKYNKNMKNFSYSFFHAKFLPLYMGSEKPSERMLTVLLQKKNPSAKRWNILTLSSEKDCFERFRKWDRIVQ